jgi:hypothetical protein
MMTRRQATAGILASTGEAATGIAYGVPRISIR